MLLDGGLGMSLDGREWGPENEPRWGENKGLDMNLEGALGMRAWE